MRKPLILAHRGASYEMPGNTLPAILKAIKDGADVIEVDLRRTRGGEIILAHNETVIGSKISDLDYPQIQEMFKRHRLPFCPPTLLKVLETVPKDTFFYFDIKEEGIKEELIRVFRKSGLKESWYSNKQSLIFAYTPLLYYYPFVPVTLYKIGVSHSTPDPMPCFIPERASIHYYEHIPSLVKFVHGLGRKLFFWGVDTKREMEKCIELKVDGILTDRPGVLKQL